MFFGGAPERIKLHVAPASRMAWLTDIFILDVLNIVSAWADSQRLCIAIVCCHAVLHVGGSISICGSWSGFSIILMEESSDKGSVQAVTLSLQLLW